MGRRSKGRMGHGLITAMAMLAITGMLFFAPVVWSQPDDQIIKAQRMLGALGYDPGIADGKIGPQTRRAIEAFQRTYNLPISRELDRHTLNALGLAPLELEEAVTQAPPPAMPSVPWRVVLSYLRYFDTQPARLLTYVTERFRQGMPPHDWIQHMAATLADQKFSRLSWQIERVAPNSPDSTSQTTVQVHSRVRIADEEIARREIFTVVWTDNTQWLIDEWRSSVIPADGN